MLNLQKPTVYILQYCRVQGQLWWLVAQTAVSLWLSSPALVPCLLDFLPMLVQSPTSPGEKREAL